MRRVLWRFALAAFAAGAEVGTSDWYFPSEVTGTHHPVWRYSNCCCAARPDYTTAGCERFHDHCNPNCVEQCPTKCCAQAACNATQVMNERRAPWQDAGVAYWNKVEADGT